MLAGLISVPAWARIRAGRKIMSSEFRRECYIVNILGSQLSPGSINLVPAQAGKVIVGLASHWPCVADNRGITTYGLMALGREMSTSLHSSRSMAHFTFTFYHTVVTLEVLSTYERLAQGRYSAMRRPGIEPATC